MTDAIEEFGSEVYSTTERAERFCYATTAKELQLEAIEELETLRDKALLLKKKVVDEGLEDLANRMLSYEKALQALSSELQMWVALREDKADEAWDALVNAQAAARWALVAHDISGHLSAYLKRLKQLEALLFPGVQFLSVGMLVRRSTCSICGTEYGDCNHLKGKVYMGEICARVIEAAELIETSLVDEPTNRHCRVTRFTNDGVTRDTLTWRIVG